MASAPGTGTLQNVIFPLAYSDQPNEAVDASLQVWLSSSGADKPTSPSAYIQKTWDGFVTTKVPAELLDRVATPDDKARLLTAGAAHAGDWLLAPAITAVCLRLDAEPSESPWDNDWARTPVASYLHLW